MSKVIRLAGVDITDDVHISSARFKGCANGKVGEASLRILDRSHVWQPGEIHAGQKLELILDGTRVWDGYVMRVGRAYTFDVDDTTNPMATPRWWTIMGVDRNVLLQRRVLFNQDDPLMWSKQWPAGSSDRDAIIWMQEHFLDLVDLDVDLTGHIDEIASPGPYEIFRLGTTGAPWGTIYEDCAQMTGAVYAIWPNDRAIHYHEDLDVTAPHILCNEPFLHDDAIGYRECTNWREAMEMANEAWVWGAGRGNANPVFAKYRDDDSVDAHGLWQWSDQWSGANQTKTVEKRAESYVLGSNSHRRGHNHELPNVELTVFNEKIWAGLVAEFHQHQFDISEPLPIAEITFTFPTPTVVREDVVLSLRYDTPYGWIDPWSVDENIPPGDRSGDPPPPIPVEGSTIDEFDRSHYLIPDGFGWGTATNGGEWTVGPDTGGAGSAVIDWYVDGDFGHQHVDVISSDTGNAPTGNGHLDFPFTVPYNALWRWRMQVPDSWSNGYHVAFGWNFTNLSSPPFVNGQLFDFTPTDPGDSSVIWKETIGADASEWHRTYLELDDAGNLSIKTWLENEDEPTEWDVTLPTTGALTGDSIWFYWNTEATDTDTDDFEFIIDWIRFTGVVPTFPPATSGVDIRAYGWTGYNDRYQTQWPYEPGSLEITFQGITLRRGVDFFEVDPENGIFRISPDVPGLASADNSDELQIRYKPVGSKETTPAPVGGSVGDTHGNHYRPAKQQQLGWGTPFDGTNCAATSSAMLLDRHTLGALSPTSGSPRSIPPNIRYYSGNRSLQGGLTQHDCMRAWQVGWGQTLSYPGFHSWNYFRAAIASGRAAAFSGIYGVLPARLRFSSSFRGPHSIYVNEELADGNYLVFDPLTRKSLVYTPSELLAYGQAFTGIGGTVSASYCKRIG